MGKLKTIVRAGQDATKVVKPIGRLEDARPAGNLGGLDEYLNYASKKDAENFNPTMAEVDAAIAAEDAAFEEARRIDRITNPQSGFEATYWQTNGADEFAERFNKQIQNDDFGARVTLEQNNEVIEGMQGAYQTNLEGISLSRKRFQKFNESITSKLSKDPRWMKGVEDWSEGSPYQGQVLVHMDRQTDPYRAGTFDQIQFEDARELGVHSGTPAAAEHAAIINHEFSTKLFDKLDNDLRRAEELLGMEAGEIDNVVGQAIDRYFLQSFSPEKILTHEEIFGEIVPILEDAMGELGLPKMQAGKIIGDMTSLPTANATPHLFRGKNGLLLQDNGTFGNSEVMKQLEALFPDDVQALDAIGGSRKERMKGIRDFIESKGYDHVVYINSVEDRGMYSIVNWNPDLWVSLYDEALTRGNKSRQALTAAAFFAAQLGIGGAAIRSEVNGET